MITGLLITIVVFEIIRLIVYLQDSKRVREINESARERQIEALK